MADISEWIKALPGLELDEIMLAYHELNAVLEIACDPTRPTESATAACVAFEVGFGLDLFDVAPDRQLYAELMRRLGPLAETQPGGIEGPLRLAQLRSEFGPRFEAVVRLRGETLARRPVGPSRGY